MSMNEELKKALSTLTGTTGDRLIPEVVSEGVRRFVEDASPLYSIMPKRDWPTNAYMFREVNALPTATFRADEATLPTATRGTYAKRTTAMKYVYTRGEVSGPLQAVVGPVDALQYEIELHATALIREVERTIVNGDSAVDVDEFDGLIKQITQGIANGGGSLLLAKLDEALRTPAERPTHIVTTRAHGDRINSLLQAQQRFTGSIDIDAGFNVMTYNGLPIIEVDNEAAGDLTTTVLLPDMRHIVMPIQQQVTFEPLAKTKDSDDFFLTMYLTLAVEGAARYHSKVTGATA